MQEGRVHPNILGPTGDPNNLLNEPKVTNQVPSIFGTKDHWASNYFHGTPLLALPNIRDTDLQASAVGSGSWDAPRLYTSRTRDTPVNSYGDNFHGVEGSTNRVPFLKEDGTWTSKVFACVLGIISTNPWPHHDKKLFRRRFYQHQFLHVPGTFQVGWVELICREGEKIDIYQSLIDQGNQGRALKGRGRHETALSLITPLDAESNLIVLGKAPPPRVPKPNPRNPRIGRSASTICDASHVVIDYEATAAIAAGVAVIATATADPAGATVITMETTDPEPEPTGPPTGLPLTSPPIVPRGNMSSFEDAYEDPSDLE